MAFRSVSLCPAEFGLYFITGTIVNVETT